ALYTPAFSAAAYTFFRILGIYTAAIRFALLYACAAFLSPHSAGISSRFPFPYFTTLPPPSQLR
ncbi:MAG: hypothetical protein LBD16_08385, partial [Oscillospiraceae bacterium]|nr:hypothetical protein [Oscillospiraceae bacterium]